MFLPFPKKISHQVLGAVFRLRHPPFKGIFTSAVFLYCADIRYFKGDDMRRITAALFVIFTALVSACGGSGSSSGGVIALTVIYSPILILTVNLRTTKGW